MTFPESQSLRREINRLTTESQRPERVSLIRVLILIGKKRSAIISPVDGGLESTRSGATIALEQVS
jgi:hypothetical protein